MMPKSPHYKANNEGGYGNPPIKHQFDGKPGPGRPKGSRTLEGALRKAFGKNLVRVDKQGNRTSITPPDALADRALELGLKGPLAANIEARKMFAQFEQKEEKVSNDLTHLNDVELQLYGYIAWRLVDKDREMTLDSAMSRVFQQVSGIVEAEKQRGREERAEARRKSASQLPARQQDRFDEDLDEDEDDAQ